MSSVAHRLNARVRHLPWCPECNAEEERACVTPNGHICAPHRVRERIAAGDVIAISRADARRGRKLRAILELVATLPRRRAG